MLDSNTLTGGTAGIIPAIWYKFEPIIKKYRESDYSESYYENFEFIGKRLQALHGLSTDQLETY
jgi:hypothetical protein